MGPVVGCGHATVGGWCGAAGGAATGGVDGAMVAAVVLLGAVGCRTGGVGETGGGRVVVMGGMSARRVLVLSNMLFISILVAVWKNLNGSREGLRIVGKVL